MTVLQRDLKQVNSADDVWYETVGRHDEMIQELEYRMDALYDDSTTFLSASDVREGVSGIICRRVFD